MIPISVTVTKEMLDDIDRIAKLKKENRPRASMIRILLNEAIEMRRKKKGVPDETAGNNT